MREDPARPRARARGRAAGRREVAALATLLHVTDLHFERTVRPEAADAVHRLADEVAPDAILCAGDHVERGDFDRQFRAARAFLDRFAAPVLTVPGNHDLPVWNPLARLRGPFERFRRWLAPEVEATWTLADAVIVGLCSPSRLTLDRGVLREASLERARAAFAAAPPAAARLVVVHHPLAPLAGAGLAAKHLRGHRAATRALVAAGAHAVLCGHLHFPALVPLGAGGEPEGDPGPPARGPGAPPSATASAPLGAGRRLLLVQGGTACSTRLRPRSGCGTNAVHVLRAARGRLEVETRLFVDGAFRAEQAPARFDLA